MSSFVITAEAPETSWWSFISYLTMGKVTHIRSYWNQKGRTTDLEHLGEGSEIKILVK